MKQDIFKATEKGVGITVRVTPRAGRSAVAGLGEDAQGRPFLKITITAAPVEGEANKALIETLADALDIPPSSFHVHTGQKSRMKTLMIQTKETHALAAKLNAWVSLKKEKGDL